MLWSLWVRPVPSPLKGGNGGRDSDEVGTRPGRVTSYQGRDSGRVGTSTGTKPSKSGRRRDKVGLTRTNVGTRLPSPFFRAREPPTPDPPRPYLAQKDENGTSRAGPCSIEADHAPSGGKRKGGLGVRENLTKKRHRHRISRETRTVDRAPPSWHFHLCDQARSHTSGRTPSPVCTAPLLELEGGLSRGRKHTGEQVREGARGSPYGVPVMGSRG